ncbi:tail fiber assembly protein [Sporomusa sp.]|uniref:tail fiber assembly protein n=1 Tax=Sporomusa sp. TaxID=2078658 RepID=UPI002C5A315E|nr:tail fiber assembly protein [Sporomusa sp.]HWR09894.1 tail fiber assembly protein [Sporomusa sp.]
MNKHYVKFRENGERETSIAFNVHFRTEEELQPYLDQGFIPITDEEQALYATNQYIRGADKKPVAKPPHVPTTEEKMTIIRAERDRLLTETDKYMLLDYPVTDEQREEWKVYRQALRDMPETCDPDNPAWPGKPE